MTEFAEIETIAPLTFAMLGNLVELADGCLIGTPEDPATPERAAAHHQVSVKYAASALQQALCGSPSIDLVNDMVCGPVTTQAVQDFIAAGDNRDAALATATRAMWLARELGAPGSFNRPADWLAQILA